MSKFSLLLFLAMPAVAQSVLDTSNNYLYVQYGDASFDDSGRFQAIVSNAFNLDETIATIDWSEEVFRLTEGYHLSKYLAVEGSLNFFGDTNITTSNGTRIEAGQMGLSLSVVGKYRFHRFLTVFGTLGGQYWRAETKIPGSSDASAKVKTESANVVWTIGAYAEITETMLVRLDRSSSSIDDHDYDMTSLGLGFSF